MRTKSFMGVAAVLALLLVYGPALGQPCATGPAAPADNPPNVLLIMTDDHAWPLYNFMYEGDGTTTYRYEFVDSNGGRHPNLRPLNFPAIARDGTTVPAQGMTPELDQLAAEGVVFPNGYAADSVCVPSFASTETGLNRKDNKSLKKDGAQNKISKPKGRIGDYMSSISLPVSPNYNSIAFGKSWKAFGDQGYTCVKNGSPFNCTDHKKGHKYIDSPGREDQLLQSIVDAGVSPWFVWYSPHSPHSPFDGRELVFDGVKQCEALDSPALALNFCSPPNDGGSFCDADEPTKVPRDIANKDVSDTGFELPPYILASPVLLARTCNRLRDLQVQMITASECFGNPSPSVSCGDMDPTLAALNPGFEYMRHHSSEPGKSLSKFQGVLDTIMIQDFWIGVLLDFLRETDDARSPGNPLIANTVILYQTDNGMIPSTSLGLTPGGEKVKSKGWKKSSDENGFRTPIVVRPPALNGRHASIPQFKHEDAHAVDLIPTMLHYATNRPVPVCALGVRPSVPQWDDETLVWDAAPGGVESEAPCLEGISLRSAAECVGTPGNHPDSPVGASVPAKREYLFAHKGSKLFLRKETGVPGGQTHGFRLFRKSCPQRCDDSGYNSSNAHKQDAKFRLYNMTRDLDENCDLLDPSNLPPTMGALVSGCVCTILGLAAPCDPAGAWPDDAKGDVCEWQAAVNQWYNATEAAMPNNQSERRFCAGTSTFCQNAESPPPSPLCPSLPEPPQ